MEMENVSKESMVLEQLCEEIYGSDWLLSDCNDFEMSVLEGKASELTEAEKKDKIKKRIIAKSVEAFLG